MPDERNNALPPQWQRNSSVVPNWLFENYRIHKRLDRMRPDVRLWALAGVSEEEIARRTGVDVYSLSMVFESELGLDREW